MYNINKSLSNYLEIHREKHPKEIEAVEAVEVVKTKRPKVDINEAMDEIDASIARMNHIVKRDLAKIAMLDSKIHS